MFTDIGEHVILFRPIESTCFSFNWFYSCGTIRYDNDNNMIASLNDICINCMNVIEKHYIIRKKKC